MTLDDFRLEMASYRQSVDNESKLLKNPSLALEKLRALYDRFDSAERLKANEVLTEWVLSDDEGVRFDALALIDELKIRAAAPALNELIGRLGSSGAPSTPYELKKVLRILASL